MKRILLIVMVLGVGLFGGIACGSDKPQNTDSEESATGLVSDTIEGLGNDSEMASTSEAITDTVEATTEVSEEEKNPRENVLIAIDPGHQSEKIDMSAKEPNAPGSSEMKTKATGGTTGKYTGVPEYQLNLDISLKLRDGLQAMGYKVIMTREDNDTAISNMERAQMANNAGADIAIRIHANGSEDSGTNGALALIGSESNAYVGHLYEASYHLADSVLNAYCEATGMKNLGVTTNDTMTGINWSEIPVMILEMGFMSNEADDRNMQAADYQEKMVSGIIDGIEKYYGFVDGIDRQESDNREGLPGDEDIELKNKVDELLMMEREQGAVASAYMKNLKTGEYVNLSTATHRAASIIKLYIAGCVYQNMTVLTAAGDSEDDIDMLVKKMITESDNDSANALVMMLGGNDADAGISKVTQYAKGLGYTETSMGRLMLDFNSEGENYTTVTETASFLEKLYNGEVNGADKILAYMKAQERTSKIPAGVPEGVIVANKTGELNDVTHDVAIVYGDKADYIICVMLSQIDDTAFGVSTIKEISSEVYERWK